MMAPLVRRFQPLVDNDQVENIVIAGCDNVRLELADGTVLQVSPVAESDEELIEFLVFLANTTPTPSATQS